jgi:outer membrane protein assembly factor BamD (BamD/ComL family)
MIFSLTSTSLVAEQSPELLLQEIKIDLKNIELEALASHQISQQSLNDSNRILGQLLIKNAYRALASNDYYGAIGYFNSYLNKIQVPVPSIHLGVRAKLGIAYENIGRQDLALSNYLNYLSLFLSSQEKNYDEMLDVLRRLVTIATNGKSQSPKELAQLVSSLVSIELPKHFKDQVLYYSAKTAAHIGNQKLAGDWLIEASSSRDPKLKSRALYLRSLLAIASQQWNAAESLLKQSLDAEESLDVDMVSLAYLALARVSIRQRHLALGLTYYEKISDDNPHYAAALFERVYLHYELGQHKTSRQLAGQFIAKFPNHSDAFKLRTLIAYLDLKAGDLKTARLGIQSSNAELTAIALWLQNLMPNAPNLKPENLAEIARKTKGILPLNELVSKGLELYSSLNEQNYRLEILDQEMNSTLYSVGSIDLSILNPTWHNRALQLDKIAKKSLLIGHKLVAAEKYLYTNLLSPVEKQFLQASEDRRIESLSAMAKMRRERDRWKTFAEYSSLDVTHQKTAKQIEALRAQIASIDFVTANLEGQSSSRGDIRQLVNQLERINQNFTRSKTILNKSKINAMDQHGFHQIAKRFMIQYSLSLVDEAGVLQNLRSRLDSPSDRFIAGEINELWKNWKFVAEGTFSHLLDLEQDIQQGIKQTLDSIDHQRRQNSQLRQHIAEIQNRLQLTLSSSAGIILSQYQKQIETRLDRQRNWEAEVEWLEAQGKSKELSASREKYALENQILKDNLEDFYHGVF